MVGLLASWLTGWLAGCPIFQNGRHRFQITEQTTFLSIRLGGISAAHGGNIPVRFSRNNIVPAINMNNTRNETNTQTNKHTNKHTNKQTNSVIAGVIRCRHLSVLDCFHAALAPCLLYLMFSFNYYVWSSGISDECGKTGGLGF
jgi:hypothetical protein